MKTKVAINGFGRIGRLALRHLIEHPMLEIIAVNDIAPLDNLFYLIRYDSVQKNPETNVEMKNGSFSYGNK